MSLEDVHPVTALRARAHPLRLRMLSLLTGAPMSAAELGRELGISQALASYHLRFLVDAGAVSLAEEVVNRGGRERRYRYHADQPEPTTPPAPEGLELLLTAAIDELRRRHAERDPEGRNLTIDAELWVSDDDWDAFRDAVHDAGVRLHNRAQRPRTPGTRRVGVTTFAFTMTDAQP
jgi:DNA-binding transcriptional ArsR family regulator